MRKKILLTGTCGFVFSNFVRYLSRLNNYSIVSIDRADEKLGLHSIYSNKTHSFYLADVTDRHILENIFELEQPDIVIHGAARTFVDESIDSSDDFYTSNIIGTKNIAELSSKHNVDKFIYISTDEVYGHFESDTSDSWTEQSLLNPRNPYSASKAGAEFAVKAVSNTFGLNYNITRCCNNFGPRQFSRNFIPKVIGCILSDKKIPIYGDGSNVREWIHVNDHCNAIFHIMNNGQPGEIYNIGTNCHISNLELVNIICNKMGRGHNLISFVEDRKGHDFKYAIDSSKLHNLGWEPSLSFNKGIDMVISWYSKNKWFIK